MSCSSCPGRPSCSASFRPGPIEFGWIEPVDNPLGMSGLRFLAGDGSFNIMFLAYATAVVLATVGIVRRYRRGGPVVRAQIRWVAAAIATPMVLVVLLALSSGNDTINSVAWSAWIVSLVLPPIAIGVSIRRYHLYEIDRIVSRTIAYVVITAVLVCAYALSVVVIQGPLGTVTGGETISVALSTLVVAALFQPVRRRVQAIVDRRFDRARIDADRTTSAFSERLRDEVDIETVTTDLRETVRATVRPDRLGVWLREAGR